jgi:hypothetical protein
MVVVRHYILEAFAVLILLCACSPVSFGLTTDGRLGQALAASGALPDPSVLVLLASTLVSATLCKRVNRRIKTGS